MAAGAGAEHRPCAAVAAGFARKADSGKRSFAGCLFAGRDLPQCGGSAAIAELPGDRRSLAAACPRRLSGGSFSGFPGAGSASTTIPAMGAFYAPTRNFFTGVLTPGIGKFATRAQVLFGGISAAREISAVAFCRAPTATCTWSTAVSDQVGKFRVGQRFDDCEDSCGCGWQVLATSSASSEGGTRRFGARVRVSRSRSRGGKCADRFSGQ